MFMISGYVYGIVSHFDTNKGWFYSARKNLVSIYLPYLWFSYFGFAVSLIIFRGNSNPINYNMAQFSEFFRIPYIGFREYWFLCTLFQVKLVHSIFDYIFRKTIYCTTFWVVVFIALNCFTSHLQIYVYRFQFGLYFHIGYILKTRSLINSDRNPGILCGIILVIAGSAFHFIPELNISIASAVCMCLGLFTLFYTLRIKPTFLVLAGSTSMVMFILHDYVIFSLALIFKFTGIMRDMPFVAAVLTFVLAVSVSLFVVWLYKNVKHLHWIEYIFYPGKLLLKK